MGSFLQTLHVGFSPIAAQQCADYSRGSSYNVKYYLGRTQASAAESVAVLKQVLTDESVCQSHWMIPLLSLWLTAIFIFNNHNVFKGHAHICNYRNDWGRAIIMDLYKVRPLWNATPCMNFGMVLVTVYTSVFEHFSCKVAFFCETPAALCIHQWRWHFWIAACLLSTSLPRLLFFLC